MPLYTKAKDEITRMLKIGVISPVGHLTEWHAPVVVTPNPNGKVCMDLTKLNEYIQCENHPLPSVNASLRKVTGVKYVTKLDVRTTHSHL